jgi:hypothetical protein
MFIIPFIHTSRKGNGNIIVNIINVLTQGGINLWEEDDNIDIENTVLLPNSLYAKNIIVSNATNDLPKIALCDIDITKTNMEDFYKWSDISANDAESFCWRYFISINDENGNEWLPIPDKEMLGNLNLKMLLSDILKDERV